VRKLVVFATFAFGLAGCAANIQTVDRLESGGENPRIVLMPPDIRYYRLSTGGVIEPNKEWTEAAQANFVAATRDFAESIGADLKILGKDNLGPQEVRYETLHSAVGMAVRKHYFGSEKLPGKGGQFDWSLGPEVRAIGENHAADYALFVFYRDYQASSGRTAVSIVAAATGASLDTGSEAGFASLVDLETGDIVWFNVVNAGSGELREKSGAETAVKTLYKNMPGS
jgi:hypothetical protein